MKHFVIGYSDMARKGAVTVLYAGDSRAAARGALFSGGDGIVLADYVCQPQVSQTKRFRAVLPTKPPAKPKAEKPPAKPKADKPPTAKPLPLPSKHADTPATVTPGS